MKKTITHCASRPLGIRWTKIGNVEMQGYSTELSIVRGEDIFSKLREPVGSSPGLYPVGARMHFSPPERHFTKRMKLPRRSPFQKASHPDYRLVITPIRCLETELAKLIRQHCCFGLHLAADERKVNFAFPQVLLRTAQNDTEFSIPSLGFKLELINCFSIDIGEDFVSDLPWKTEQWRVRGVGDAATTHC